MPPAPEPDGTTADAAVAADGPDAPEPATARPVRRHGAGPGSRWLALAGIVLALTVAVLLVWWGLNR